jgi:hypothetical protein
MHMKYNPSNWYWIVAGSTTQVWASARCQYVPVADATYVAWLAAGNLPSRIGSVAELVEVLQQQWMPQAIAGGVAVTSSGTPALNGTYAVDAGSQANIAALSTGIAAGKPLPGGGATFNYPDIEGTQHAFSAANFLNFAAAIEGYIYALDQALATLVNGGSAALPSTPLAIA